MLSFFIEMELKIPLLYFIITLKLIINSTMIPGDGNSSSNQCENLIPQKIQNRCNLYPCGDENCSGFHNMQFVDFYRSYADEDGEESREDVTCDYTFEPCGELLRQERSEAVFGALDELSYREREVIRSHIGFCPDCHSMKSPKFRPHTFQEIAYKNELSSAEAAENIYRKGLDKMRDKLKKKGIYHS